MTTEREALISGLVDRFLSWPLPESVCSDLCATMRGYKDRSGTTLLTAEEARQMIEHLLAEFMASSEATQAKLDRVMLEYCPDEMTPEQIENWKAYQRAYADTLSQSSDGESK